MHPSFPRTGGTVAGLFLLTALPAGAQDRPGTASAPYLAPVEVARMAKAATVLVQEPPGRPSRFSRGGFSEGGFGRGGAAPGGGFGRGSSRPPFSSLAAGFCVHPAGLFLTSYSAVSGGDGSPVRLVCRPGFKTQQEVEARILRSDRTANLALLWAPEAADLPALALGSETEVRERAEVITCGSPMRSIRSRGGRGFPLPSAGLLIKRSQVLSPPEKKGELEMFRLSAGTEAAGLVLDRRGRVVGLAAGAGEPGEALSVSGLREFLRDPVLLLSVPSLKTADVHRPTDFGARMIHPLGDPTPAEAPLQLELVVKAGDGKERRFKMAGKAGSYRATAVPVPLPAKKPKIRVAITYPDGNLEGLADGQEIVILGKSYPLHSLVALRRVGEAMLVVFADGKFVECDAAGLPPLAGEVGGEPWSLGLRQARAVDIKPPEKVSAVTFTVIASRGEAEVARQAHTIALATPEDAGAAGRQKVAELDLVLGVVGPLFDSYARGKKAIDITDVPGAIAGRERLEDFARRENITAGQLTRVEFIRYLMEEQRSRAAFPPSRGGFDRNSRFGSPGGGFPGRPTEGRRGRRGGPGNPFP